MNLVLNEEQRLIQQTAVDFFEKNTPVAAFRQLAKGGKYYCPTIWQRMADMGWTGALIPQQQGGCELGLSAVGLITMEAARYLVASPYVASSILSASALLLCKPSESRDQLLIGIADGSMKVVLVTDSDLVSEGGVATHFLSSQNEDLWVVEAGSKPVSSKAISLIDRRNYVKLDIQSAALTTRLAWQQPAAGSLRQLDDIAVIMSACELCAISQEVFERTIAYLKEREQFGQKIGAFQALQHRAAQAFVQLELLISVIYQALGSLDNNSPDCSLSASHAKTFANDTARLITNEAFQMHGGIGLTEEFDIGLFYKRARVLQTLHGSSNYHRQRFAILSGF